MSGALIPATRPSRTHNPPMRQALELLVDDYLDAKDLQPSSRDHYETILLQFVDYITTGRRTGWAWKATP